MKRRALFLSLAAALLAFPTLHAQIPAPAAPPTATPFPRLEMDDAEPTPLETPIPVASAIPVSTPVPAPAENPLQNIELPPATPAASTPSTVPATPALTPASRLSLPPMRPTAAPVQPFASPSASAAPQSVASLDPGTKLTPLSQPLFAASDKPLGNVQLIIYFIVLALLVIGGLVLIKRGIGIRAGRNTEQRLNILETKMLGNRQFLLVVAYEDSRMLLGVSPGKIEFLTALDTELPETAEMINLATMPPSKISPENEL